MKALYMTNAPDLNLQGVNLTLELHPVEGRPDETALYIHQTGDAEKAERVRVLKALRTLVEEVMGSAIETIRFQARESQPEQKAGALRFDRCYSRPASCTEEHVAQTGLLVDGVPQSKLEQIANLLATQHAQITVAAAPEKTEAAEAVRRSLIVAHTMRISAMNSREKFQAGYEKLMNPGILMTVGPDYEGDVLSCAVTSGQDDGAMAPTYRVEVKPDVVYLPNPEHSLDRKNPSGPINAYKDLLYRMHAALVKKFPEKTDYGQIVSTGGLEFNDDQRVTMPVGALGVTAATWRNVQKLVVMVDNVTKDDLKKIVEALRDVNPDGS